ncbi:pickpocket protein 28-like isoform X2 [Pectinophora gossypiella]|nr:pickpocket protein 28-like isoform X2 [Pectinophora gossypiella]
MCFYLISNVWIKWKTSPVIVSFSERVVPVGDVPFPAVTICPQLKAKASIFNFSDEYQKYLKLKENGTDPTPSQWESWIKLDDVDMLCGKDVAEIDLTRDLGNSSMIENFLEVAPTEEDVIIGCVFRGEPCNSFERVITSDGVCYTFNALAASEILRQENVQQDYHYLESTRESKNWSIEGGYTGYSSDTYPRRGRENIADPDLMVYLAENPLDRDGLCNAIGSGYKIYIQHPADLPQASLYYYAALPGQVSSIALKFSMVMTSDSLEGYSPDIRQCYFPSDRQLRYFRIYTPNNCRLECRSNHTFSKCNCVWYHMPHNDSRQICVSDWDTSCMKQSLDELSVAELEANVDGINASACQCLPSCDSVQYDAEILKTDFKIQSLLKNMEAIHNTSTYYSSLNISKIELYFKEPRFVSMRRSELFGVTDFLANCGGLLGLFLGFSILSAVEIFYFLTFRLCFILKRDLREEKVNREREKEN